MKDQYVGDVNDFAKYQLLRICQDVFEHIVVAWMLTSADERGDGARISYLKDLTQRALDPELFDELADMIAAGERNLGAVESARMLQGCIFVSEPMSAAENERSEYFKAITALVGSDSLVFFDPDNGLEVPSVARHRKNSERYLYWEELQDVRAMGASVLVYQHFPRVERSGYVDEKLSQLNEEMGSDYATFAVRSSQVAFLFAIRNSVANSLAQKIAERCSEAETLVFVDRRSALVGSRLNRRH